MCPHLYTECGFSIPYPLTRATGDTIGHSLRDFIHDYGAPSLLTFDGASIQVGRDTLFMKTLRDYRIDYHVSSPRHPNENPSEGSIRDIKTRWYRIMTKKNVPPRLWDFGFIWTCETGNLSVSSSRYADGRTPIEIITGETPDISEYLDFSFYDWVTYRQNSGLGPLELGRWLGVSHKLGDLMSYWILPQSGKPISCVTVQRLTELEQDTRDWKLKMDNYDKAIHDRLDIKQPHAPIFSSITDTKKKLSMTNDDEFISEYSRIIDNESIPEADDSDDLKQDEYLNMELSLPRGHDNSPHFAHVVKRS